MPRIYTTTPPEIRFWAKVDKTSSPHGCWLWTAKCGNGGYGRFYVSATLYGVAHRFSWELVHGTVPDGLLVLHNCPGGDNPRCVNPDHLFLGTNLANTQDMIAKGRRYPVVIPATPGEAHPQARLTDEAIRTIRQLRAEGLPYRAIAGRYGVSHTQIQRIIAGQNWRHVA